ncbi:helix-turn-helix domain-containing protein [Leptolyngbya sp. 15MV]|nr:helix-turn-helix domain-containing protein [Leptolyngbya sp. 15MV]
MSGAGDAPVSISRAAGPKLSPWIARLYATWIRVPGDGSVDCGLLADTASMRVFIKADAWAETRDGRHHHGRGAFFFGPQSRRMRVNVRGSFATVGIGFRPGASHALRGEGIGPLVDRVVPVEHFGGDSAALVAAFEGCHDPREWLDILEKRMEQVFANWSDLLPDPVTAAFDRAAFADPNRQIADIADELGCTRRRLERIVRRDFGLSPKQVLRRARALDMAAKLRGVVDARESEELALRYYDQSHLTRDFVTFFGMTPAQFANTPQPLMTNTLEIRQARRLEELERLRPGEPYPWRGGD